MLIDLHTHTSPYSDDSLMSPDDLVEAAKGAGLDGVCITEHGYFWESSEILDLSRRHRFLVIPGCEVNTDAGHALVFGLEQYLYGMHKPVFLRDMVDKAGGIMIAAHPYRRRYLPEKADEPDAYESMLDKACVDQFFSFCDAVEVLNGRATDGETSFSNDLCRCLGLGMAGGSDGHRLEDLGKVATRFHRDISSLEDLIGEITAGRFEPIVLGIGEVVTPLINPINGGV